MNGLKIVESYADATLLQQAFLNMMSAKAIGYEQGIDVKLKAIAESMGVKFRK